MRDEIQRCRGHHAAVLSGLHCTRARTRIHRQRLGEVQGLGALGK
jgi:hypothetical protein